MGSGTGTPVSQGTPAAPQSAPATAVPDTTFDAFNPPAPPGPVVDAFNPPPPATPCFSLTVYRCVAHGRHCTTGYVF